MKLSEIIKSEYYKTFEGRIYHMGGTSFMVRNEETKDILQFPRTNLLDDKVFFESEIKVGRFVTLVYELKTKGSLDIFSVYDDGTKKPIYSKEQ